MCALLSSTLKMATKTITSSVLQNDLSYLTAYNSAYGSEGFCGYPEIETTTKIDKCVENEYICLVPSVRAHGTKKNGSKFSCLEQIVEMWMLDNDMSGRQDKAVFGLFELKGLTKEQGEEALALLTEVEQNLIREFRSFFADLKK